MLDTIMTGMMILAEAKTFPRAKYSVRGNTPLQTISSSSRMSSYCHLPPPPLSLLNDQREKDPRATLSKIIHTPSHALTHSLFRSLSVRLLLQQAGIGSRRKGGDARLAYPDIAIPTYPPA